MQLTIKHSQAGRDAAGEASDRRTGHRDPQPQHLLRRLPRRAGRQPGHRAQKITAIIGPSGCGKSTVLRSFNRMNELMPGTRTTGEVLFHGHNIYDPQVDPVEVRRRIGMVFQKPNPFPKTIYENIAWGARINGYRGNMDELVEKTPAPGGPVGRGQGQAGPERPAPVRRPAAAPVHRPRHRRPAGDHPDGRARLGAGPDRHPEDRGADAELARRYTIVIVTHNMQQAARISDYTCFLMVDEGRTGFLVEYAATEELFVRPRDKRTEDYISGRFG